MNLWEDNNRTTTSRFLTKINANYKTKTPSKRGLSNLTINFNTGDRGHHCYNTAVLDDRLQHHCNNRFNCNNSAFDQFSKRIFMQHFEYTHKYPQLSWPRVFLSFFHFIQFVINHLTQFQQVILTGKLIDEFLRLRTISIYLLLLLVSSLPFFVRTFLCF